MVEQRLIKAIQSAQPDVAFIVAYQNAPVAEHVFCEVYAIGDKFAGLPVFSNDSTTETVSTIYKYKVSLSYNGLVTSGAHDKAKHMSNFLQSFQARLALKEHGFSLLYVDDISTIPIVKDADMYMKHVLDICIASEESDQFDIDVIDTVTIHADLDTTKHDFIIGG